jgi:hypothetical protein
VLAACILLLALVETLCALLAPRWAPAVGDWRAAAAEVRKAFRPGDLIVAAPAWADQVMRLHLGDLVPVAVAARLDSAKYARVWEVSQRGASAPETSSSARRLSATRHGALNVRLFEQTPRRVTFDFLAQWAQARVVRLEPGRGEIACERLLDRHQCPHLGFNFVKPQLLEMGTTMRNALYAQPVDGATVVAEWREVPLGRELAVGSGLHHVWLRKIGSGQVELRVLVDGVEIGRTQASSRTGWHVERFDTSAASGKKATVRFEIQSSAPYSRHFGFAAEARL